MKIHITVTYESDLNVESIWPDGDAPAVVTVEAVLAVIKAAGGAKGIVRDWDLDTDPQLDVWVTS